MHWGDGAGLTDQLEFEQDAFFVAKPVMDKLGESAVDPVTLDDLQATTEIMVLHSGAFLCSPKLKQKRPCETDWRQQSSDASMQLGVCQRHLEQRRLWDKRSIMDMRAVRLWSFALSMGCATSEGETRFNGAGRLDRSFRKGRMASPLDFRARGARGTRGRHSSSTILVRHRAEGERKNVLMDPVVAQVR